MCDPNLYVVAATTGANTLSLHAIPPLRDDVTVTHARIRCTTLGAATSARSGIYIRQPNGFHLVSGTEALYDTSTTGIKVVKLNQEHTFVPEAQYFMAFVCTSATPAFCSVAGSGGGMFPKYTLTATGALPRYIDPKSITALAGTITGVMYYTDGVGE